MLLAVLSTACGASPPASRFPSGQAAIDRMRGTFECLRGVRGEAKLDHMGRQGRIRGGLMFFAVEPAAVRFDVVSPFGVTLATLTSDGARFAFNDLREKKFLEGPASACNIARLTQVPVPGHALVSLLRGEAPVLVHQPEDTTVRWSGGRYLVRVPSKHGAVEEIALGVHPADYHLPWSEQRVRVLGVEVRQEDVVLYRADLGEHAPIELAQAIVDEDGIDPPVPPSGPPCNVEVPRKIHVEVPYTRDDVRFRYDEVRSNPPLPEGLFTQPVPGGVERVRVGACSE
ncbi:MAG: hypothetical protein IT374_17150 [Polyangiaceae bacterium]|nr:hypothetical protein [Polyangiaceae bacterium]